MVATSNPTSNPPNIQLKVEVLPTTDLLQPSRKRTLRTLSRLINDTFALHGHPKDNGDTKPGALFTRKRLIYDEELAESFGEGALTAICTDETLGDYDAPDAHGQPGPETGTGRYANIVATGSVTPFKGKMVDRERAALEAVRLQANGINTDVDTSGITDEQLTTAAQDLANDAASHLYGYWNWEVKLCSSSEEPEYRGRGLMIRCVDALIVQLKSRQVVMKQAGDPKGDLPIKLWVTALNGTGNTEYWIRRGYEMVGEADVAPAGMWTSTREISISTLSKVVE